MLLNNWKNNFRQAWSVCCRPSFTLAPFLSSLKSYGTKWARVGGSSGSYRGLLVWLGKIPLFTYIMPLIPFSQALDAYSWSSRQIFTFFVLYLLNSRCAGLSMLLTAPASLFGTPVYSNSVYSRYTLLQVPYYGLAHRNGIGGIY